VYFTDRQLKVLSFIHSYTQAHSKAPTLGEIASNFGFTKVTALAHLRALEKKEAIRRRRHQPRSIELVDSPPTRTTTELALPLAGEFRDGHLDYDVPNQQLDVSSLLPRQKNGHLLRVRGNALQTAAIKDGDLLVVEPSADIRVGEMIIVATARATGIVGLVVSAKGEFRLQDVRASAESKSVHFEASQIRGVIRAVLRNLGPASIS
jgi:SOS-response transcriptional repressor LexA